MECSGSLLLLWNLHFSRNSCSLKFMSEEGTSFFFPAAATIHLLALIPQSLKIWLLPLTLALHINSCKFQCARWLIPDDRGWVHGALHLQCPVLLFSISYLLPWECPVPCQDPKTSHPWPHSPPYTQRNLSCTLHLTILKWHRLLQSFDATASLLSHSPWLPSCPSWAPNFLYPSDPPVYSGNFTGPCKLYTTKPRSQTSWEMTQ